jgi:hypothetical protein
VIKTILNFLLIVILPVLPLCAQENNDGPENYEPELIESAVENTEEEVDATILTEQLQYFMQHKLDINTATEKDFEKINLLTPFQINSIIEYRQIHGNFLTVFELNGVSGISTATLTTLIPFIKIVPAGEAQIAIDHNGIKQTIVFNSGRTIEQQSGYAAVADSIKSDKPNSYYPGNPFRIKTRYSFEKGDYYKAGFTAEKDPGKTWFSGSNKTFDFVSGYLQVQKTGIIDNLIAGDYIANFGQGLVLWNGFDAGKSAFSLNIKKQTEGFDRYASFNENQFFRGIASTVKISNFRISGFYSNHHIDANAVTFDSTGKLDEISALQNSGSHALQNEIADEDAIGERIIGGNVNFERGYLKIGTTIMSLNYDASFQKSVLPYKYYAFTGNNLLCGGVNYQLRFRKLEIFGEAARNSMKGNAFLNGVSFQIIPELSFALLYRYFEPAYFSPFAKTFSQNSLSSNENGIYAGIELIPYNKIKINAYADFFKFPYLKYRVSAPSSGNNFFLQTAYDPSEYISFSARYSYLKNMEDGTTIQPNPPVQEDVILQKIRFHAAFRASENIELRNRLEMVFYNKENTKQNGYLIYQDIIWKPENIKFSFAARYAIFETDGYESRIYSYENDVMYSYSVPAFIGKGSRVYAMLRYHPIKNAEFWLRYGSVIYADRETISSGPDEIKGNTKSDVTVQLILKF